MIAAITIYVTLAVVCVGLWVLFYSHSTLLTFMALMGTLLMIGGGVGSAFGLWSVCGAAAIMCGLMRLPTKRFVSVVSVVAMLFTAYRVADAWIDHREIAALHRDFPALPLAERMTGIGRPVIETELPADAARPSNLGWPAHQTSSTLTERFAERLTLQARESGPWRSRDRMLRTLQGMHNGTVDEFFHREGFGAIRTIRMWPRREMIELPQPTPIPLPETVPSFDTGSVPLADLAPTKHDLTELHLNGLLSFFDEQAFGHVTWNDNPQSRNVIGFQSHAFRAMPTWPKTGTWQIVELELVSLLKPTSPFVYQTDYLPNLHVVTHDTIPQRPLESFERSALERLANGEDLIVDNQSLEIRAVGALRSARQCAQCHDVDDGTLLGAFTYRLKPIARSMGDEESPSL